MKVWNGDPGKVYSAVCIELFVWFMFVISANDGYPTSADFDHVHRITNIDSNSFPPEMYRHLMKETEFVHIDSAKILDMTKGIVFYENQQYRQKLFALVKKARYSYSFLFLNLLKRIAEYLIGSSPRNPLTSSSGCHL